MSLLFIANWWSSLSSLKQAFWSMAIISTLLLGIYFILRQFDIYQSSSEPQPSKRRIGSYAVLLFFFMLGWSSALFLTSNNWAWILAIGSAAGFITVWLTHKSGGPAASASRTPGDYLTTTGEVLQSIPPHRNGFGKVHLNHRSAPYEMEAITAGKEIPRGAPVRVVSVIDSRVVLVEPIEQNERYPGQRK
ncbi:MAG TPA: NfeD family protein [Flavilitoribacter sp.]|nr:NfeD family protein [Flavilitoribacter sp.]HMQ88494.1 NfeD family protein [Flavilitoribacter sp.]